VHGVGVAAEAAAASARQALVRLLLQITADDLEPAGALYDFGSSLARVTAISDLTEWDLRDTLGPAWIAYCG
jgi:hypothetical protein